MSNKCLQGILSYIFVFVFLFFSGCTKKSQPPQAVEVTTYKIELQTIPADIEFVGVAESSHLVEIRSRVEGYLWKIAYVEGSFVKEGDLLFEIDPRQFLAAVEEAKGELARQKAILWAAEQSVSRYKPLYEEKAASKKDLDDATAKELAGKAAVIMAEANLEKAELNLSYTMIKSPIDGMTERSKYREGTLISPSINGYLTNVSVIDPIWVIFSVADYYLLSNRQQIANKQLQYPADNNFDVYLTLSDGSEYPHVGKVNFASPVLDQATGTMTVRAIFSNPDKLLRPGQFVRATVKGATHPDAIIVPQKSVQQGAKGLFVFVVNPDGKAESRLIEAGDWYKDYWIVKSGLQAGEVVIVDGVNKISNGTPVKVKE